MSTDPLGSALLTIARNAIGARFGRAATAFTPQAALFEPGATFVTLTQNGQLRGCIGSLEPYRALATDVAENALAAAFRDPRFPPLASDEQAYTRIEVSLLAAAQARQRMSAAGRAFAARHRGATARTLELITPAAR